MVLTSHKQTILGCIEVSDIVAYPLLKEKTIHRIVVL